MKQLEVGDVISTTTLIGGMEVAAINKRERDGAIIVNTVAVSGGSKVGAWSFELRYLLGLFRHDGPLIPKEPKGAQYWLPVYRKLEMGELAQYAEVANAPT